jgi:hypothetical protein
VINPTPKRRLRKKDQLTFQRERPISLLSEDKLNRAGFAKAISLAMGNKLVAALGTQNADDLEAALEQFGTIGEDLRRCFALSKREKAKWN